jgi:hypothetical protein
MHKLPRRYALFATILGEFACRGIRWRWTQSFSERISSVYLVAAVPFAIELRIALKRLLELLRSGDKGSRLSF